MAIDSAADAKRAVDAARYSPTGLRSLSGMLPHFGYQALPAREQMAQAEALTFVVGIIKTLARKDIRALRRFFLVKFFTWYWMGRPSLR